MRGSLQLEDIIMHRVGVAECAVIGVKDARWGRVGSPANHPHRHQRRRLGRYLLDAARGRAFMAGPSLRTAQCLIHIEAAVLDRLRTMRRPGESYSDVILRLVEIEAKGTR
jgi:hypothetical protein